LFRRLSAKGIPEKKKKKSAPRADRIALGKKSLPRAFQEALGKEYTEK
jgi:hypothetical protein